MTRRWCIALLLLALGAAVTIFALADHSTLKLVSTQVVTIPSRGRALEFVLKNNSAQSSGCLFYRQQSFNGRWVPETVTLYQRADEVFYVGAGRQAAVTLRAPDSGGRFRFQIFYGKPPPLHERISELVRKKLGLRRKGLHGQWGTIMTHPIEIPSA